MAVETQQLIICTRETYLRLAQSLGISEAQCIALADQLLAHNMPGRHDMLAAYQRYVKLRRGNSKSIPLW